MAKKKKEKKEEKKSKKSSKNKKSKKSKKPKEKGEKELKEDIPENVEEMTEGIPAEQREKAESMKEELDEFKEKLLDKFDEYIMGISLLPPDKEDDEKEKINLLVLVDDSDSEKMSKNELKEKISKIVGEKAEEVNSDFNPETLLITELWQACYDGKYDYLQLIAKSAPVFDRGMLAAIKISEIHKSMVLKKFEKYIVSYVLAGSVVQGKATPESDIDVFIVIDDTDVKKMTRAELKDKLRAIIVGMGADAGEITGIKNKLNVQVYILTDFWDNIKEANPIIFTFLRDGVPFYDRGIFMPWKQLLEMGKIKPSPEAIDMYRSTGEKMLKKVDKKMKEIGMEDTFYGILTPSQAALMMYGIPPPTPKETPEVMKNVFVEDDGLLEEKYVDMLERNIKVRKDLEHGKKQTLTGEELQELYDNAEEYLERLNKLFDQISEEKEKESITEVYEKVVTIARDILKFEGIEKVSDEEIIETFEEEAVHTGEVPEKYLRMIEEVAEAKEKYDKGGLSKAEVNNIKKKSSRLIKFMIEHLQRKRGRELEKTRIKLKHGEKYGEVILLEDQAFITHDLDSDEKKVSKAKIKEDGSLGVVKDSDEEEMEEALAEAEVPEKAFIKEPIFEDLKDIFGKDVEVLVNQ